MNQALSVLEKQLENGTLRIPYSMSNSIPLHNVVHQWKPEDRLKGMLLLFEHQLKENENQLAFYHRTLNLVQPTPKELEESTRPLIQRHEKQRDIIHRRMEMVRQLQMLYEKNESYEFDLSRVYHVNDWSHSHLWDTGYGTDPECETVKVSTNSVFELAYMSFVLGIKDSEFAKDTSNRSYIAVKPTQGEFEGEEMYVPRDVIHEIVEN